MRYSHPVNWTPNLIAHCLEIQHMFAHKRRKEGNVLFNYALNTYLRLYGKEPFRWLPHRLLFPISSKGSFICIIPQTE